MSLEDAILRHAAALEKLADAIHHRAQVGTSEHPAPAVEAVEASEPNVKPTKTKPAKAKPETPAESPAAQEPPAEQPADPAALRKELSRLVLDLVAAKGKPPVFEALKAVHPTLQKQSDIPDDKVPDAIAALKAIS